jgi:hypothetical protein
MTTKTEPTTTLLYQCITLATFTISSVLRCSTGTYLVCQALSHIIALLFFFFTDTVVMLEPEVKKHYFYGVFYSYIGYPMAYLCSPFHLYCLSFQLPLVSWYFWKAFL